MTKYARVDNIKTGILLKKLRLKSNLQVKQVADALLIHVNTIYKWECGDSCPCLDNLIILKNLYGVMRIDDLLVVEE